MTNANPSPAPSSIDVQDVLFAISRHKWIILLCTILGLAVAAAVYLFSPRSYQSESDLLVKYVLERSTVDPVDSQTDTSGRYSDSLIAAEVAILQSYDLALQVAEDMGADRLLQGVAGEHSVARAAGVVAEGLDIKATKGSNVITVDFHNANPALPQPVLEVFVRRYFDKHLEVHRSTQAFDFVSQQRDLVRARLNDLDAKIKNLKEQAGIASPADDGAVLEAQVSRTRQDLMEAQAEQDEQSARVAFLVKSLGAAKSTGDANKQAAAVSTGVPQAILEQYDTLSDQLLVFRRIDSNLSSKFTEDTADVKTSRARISQVQARLADLEGQYPTLATTKASSEEHTLDLVTEQAHLAATQAKLTTLKSQLDQMQGAAAKVSGVASQIEDLESQRQVEQKNYADFQLKLEVSRIDEALDPSKIPNISVLQRPTPAVPMAGKTVKTAAGIAAGGLALGLGIALFLELVVDRSVKRPVEFERKLQLPLLLSIPALAKGRRDPKSVSSRNGRSLVSGSIGIEEAAPWEVKHFIRPFAMAMRDRLGLYFDLQKISHKPKLVGVTSVSRGAGASTIAGGLAAALSEEGEGKVLLVDMNAGHAKLHFFEGKLAYSLTSSIISGNQMAPASDNLYLATAPDPVEGTTHVDAKQLHDLLPQLKASDFDYIVFDLPPLGETSPTLPMASFMDKLLLVVEAEKSNIDLVRRSCAQLLKAKVSVSSVFNKVRFGKSEYLENGAK